MVKVIFSNRFERAFVRIKDLSLRRKVETQIEKIRTNPSVGKPMKHGRKGTRELRVRPFRLSYAYLPSEGYVYVVDLYHKKEQ